MLDHAVRQAINVVVAIKQQVAGLAGVLQDVLRGRKQGLGLGVGGAGRSGDSGDIGHGRGPGIRDLLVGVESDLIDLIEGAGLDGVDAGKEISPERRDLFVQDGSCVLDLPNRCGPGEQTLTSAACVGHDGKISRDAIRRLDPDAAETRSGR